MGGWILQKHSDVVEEVEEKGVVGGLGEGEVEGGAG